MLLQKRQFSPTQHWRGHPWWETILAMMTSSNGNIFRVTDLLCGEFTGHRWISLTKASGAELWCFLWSAGPWINGWVNNREAGDLRRHRAHYDVIVMTKPCVLYPLKTESCHDANFDVTRSFLCDKSQCPQRQQQQKWLQDGSRFSVSMSVRYEWWRHGTRSTLLVVCVGNATFIVGFSA